MYDIKKYYEAATVEEAVALLSEHPHAHIISGGSDILIKIREGKLSGCELVSIRNISHLNEITLANNGELCIGANTTFSHICGHPLIQHHVPVLGEAVAMVGGPQVRNTGTIGGNICNGAVSADSVPALFSLNARLRLAGPANTRMVKISDFYAGPGRVNLQPCEVLTHIMIPPAEYQGYTGNYIKYAMRSAMDIATLSCCIVCKTTPDHQLLEDIRITFGVAAPVPLRCVLTEEKLKGLPVNDSLYRLIEDTIRAEINPRDSWRAAKHFRLQIGGEIARRALKKAISLQEAAWKNKGN